MKEQLPGKEGAGGAKKSGSAVPAVKALECLFIPRHSFGQAGLSVQHMAVYASLGSK